MAACVKELFVCRPDSWFQLIKWIRNGFEIHPEELAIRTKNKQAVVAADVHFPLGACLHACVNVASVWINANPMQVSDTDENFTDLEDEEHFCCFGRLFEEY